MAKDNVDCILVEKGAKAASSGIFISPTKIEAATGGGVAPSFGYFCEGCIVAEAGTSAPAAGGRFYASVGATAVTPAKGDKASSAGAHFLS